MASATKQKTDYACDLTEAQFTLAFPEQVGSRPTFGLVRDQNDWFAKRVRSAAWLFLRIRLSPSAYGQSHPGTLTEIKGKICGRQIHLGLGEESNLLMHIKVLAASRARVSSA